MSVSKLLRYFAVLGASSASLSCGSRDYDNPVDVPAATPAAGSPDTAQTNPATNTPGADLPNAKPAETPEACLTDNCTPPAQTVAPAAYSMIDFFPGSQTGICSIAKAEVISNRSANRMTIIYRAKYASVGKWQLYGRNITVAANGTLTQSEPVNLFPNCAGDETGITGYNILGYASPLFTAQSKALNHSSDGDYTHIKIGSVCYSAGPDEQKSFNLATLAADNTTPMTDFLATNGAVGFWPEKNVYIKSDGSSLNPDGTAGSVNISKPFAEALEVLGSDAERLYLTYQSGFSDLYSVALSNYNAIRIDDYHNSYHSLGRHSKLGFFHIEGIYLYNVINGINTYTARHDLNIVKNASRIIGFKGFLIGQTRCEVKKINFTEKKFDTMFSANTDCKTSLGTYGNRSILTDVSATPESTGKLLLTPDLSAL